MNKIQNVIYELENLNPISINTEKVKMLCNRNIDENITIKERYTKIEQYSREILSSYADILNNSSVAFQEEAKII